MESKSGKPALAILIGEALKKKSAKKDEAEMSDSPEEEGSEEEHMQTIAEEMISAIEAKDASALKDLLLEAFTCMSNE